MLQDTSEDHPQLGLYARRITEFDFRDRPCLFLDRDGVIVEEVDYLHRIEDLRLIPGVSSAVAHANEMGIPVALVTNQAGIGRGYYGWREFLAIQNEIMAALREDNARFDMVLACAYHRDGLADYNVENHPWRKPNSGMLREAECVMGVDLSRSFIVGDNRTDLQAGRAAGLSRGALVLTGHGRREYAARENFSIVGFDWAAFATAKEAIESWLESLNT